MQIVDRCLHLRIGLSSRRLVLLMWLVLCLAVVSHAPQLPVSHAPQHFRCSEKYPATCHGCFSRLSVFSVISLESGMSRSFHPQEYLTIAMDVEHIIATCMSGLPIPLFISFSFFLVSNLWDWWRVWCGCDISRGYTPSGEHDCVAASSSTVKPDVATSRAAPAAVPSWMVVAPPCSLP